MRPQPCVYIMTNKRNGTLYTGVTGSIKHRAWQHRTKQVEGFTSEYGLTRLVYFELLESFPEAIQREKLLKKWKRAWKIQLIQSTNPKWCDLFHLLVE